MAAGDSEKPEGGGLDGQKVRLIQVPEVLQYLVQVRCEILVKRADQHVEGPLTFLGKCWRLQCGFFSIDYWMGWRIIRSLKTRQKKKTCLIEGLYFSLLFSHI